MRTVLGVLNKTVYCRLWKYCNEIDEKMMNKMSVDFENALRELNETMNKMSVDFWKWGEYNQNEYQIMSNENDAMKFEVKYYSLPESARRFASVWLYQVPREVYR